MADALRLRHHWCNAFVVECGGATIVVDPGLDLWIGRLGSLVPRARWSEATHVLVTHGDPDHYWYADRVARRAGAPLVCGPGLVRDTADGVRLLAPRRGGLRYTTSLDRVVPVGVGAGVLVDGIRVTGLPTRHGPVHIELGWLRRTIVPGPGERAGRGTIGFLVEVGGRRLVNLGDTLLCPEWAGLRPDVLMLPIGGRVARNTMDEEAALDAVRLVEPRHVVPCHYDCAFAWRRRVNPADVATFARRVRELGSECHPLAREEELVLPSQAWKG